MESCWIYPKAKDVPYQGNAGDPYTGDGWKIIPVGFEPLLIRPGDFDAKSDFSVKKINIRKEVPWLRLSPEGGIVEIYAGTTLREFIKKICSSPIYGEVDLKEVFDNRDPSDC